MAVEMNSVEELVKAMKTEQGDTNNTYPAIVARIDDEGVVWVNLAGSDIETPTASSSAEVSRGDVVNVEWRNNKLYISGNATNPSAGVTRVAAVEENAFRALTAANSAEAAATSAQASAETAEAYATQAKATTDEINAYAQTAGKTVTQILNDGETAGAAAQRAEEAAGNASEYAARALGNLSSVQSVTETLNWITSHGTMTLTTDTALDPSHVYFVQDNNGDYVIGGTHYSVVTEPDVTDISTYYELSIDQSLNNYVATHLAVDGEGLWIIPDTNGNKVLIATGNGSTYTTAGTYIIGKVNNMDTVLASFTSDGVQIGQTGQTHTEIDYHSLQLIDKEGNTYFYVSDLRDEDGNISETFIGDGVHMSVYTFASIDTSKPVTVTIDGVATTAYTVQASGVTFDSMPPDGAVIVVTYTPTSADTKAYTLGKRSAGSAIGMFSHAEGYNVQAAGSVTHAEGRNTKAYGNYSHAEGFDAKAYGNYSHAEGMSSRASGEASHAEGSNTSASGQWAHTQNVGTRALWPAQTAIGKYNDYSIQTDTAFEIGNGTDDNNRSNALTVDWSGNLKAAGDIEDGAGNTLAALADLLTVKSLSPTFNSTTGNMVTAYARRQGNIVWVSVAVNNNAAVASGRNIYQGNMSGVPYPPRFIVAGGYYGGNSIAGSIGANGDLVVRNASPSSVTISGSNSVTMSFVYIVD